MFQRESSSAEWAQAAKVSSPYQSDYTQERQWRKDDFTCTRRKIGDEMKH